jgi:hypothetical protein
VSLFGVDLPDSASSSECGVTRFIPCSVTSVTEDTCGRYVQVSDTQHIQEKPIKKDVKNQNLSKWSQSYNRFWFWSLFDTLKNGLQDEDYFGSLNRHNRVRYFTK